MLVSFVPLYLQGYLLLLWGCDVGALGLGYLFLLSVVFVCPLGRRAFKKPAGPSRPHGQPDSGEDTHPALMAQNESRFSSFASSKRLLRATSAALSRVCVVHQMHSFCLLEQR